MKYTILLCTVLCMVGQLSGTYHLVQARAFKDQLLYEYAPAGLTDSERAYLEELLLFSYERSESSLQAKIASLHHLKEAWNIDRNIALTMRDPLHDVVADPDFKSFYNLQALYNQHFEIGQRYSKIVFDLSEQSARVQEIVQKIRTQATIIRFKALLSAAVDIQKIYTLARKTAVFLIRDPKRMFVERIKTQTRFNPFNIKQFIEDLYINADETAQYTSIQCWQALMLYEDAVLECWKTVEGARSEYYKKLYEVFVNHD